MPDKPHWDYEKLINAIIMQAVRDYYYALRRHDERMISDVERFFQSEWYNFMCKIDGTVFLDKVRDDVKHKRKLSVKKPK